MQFWQFTENLHDHVEPWRDITAKDLLAVIEQVLLADDNFATWKPMAFQLQLITE